MEKAEDFMWSSQSLDESIFITIPKPSGRKIPPNPHAYASFGEDGVTASVNSYGHIMQISRYFGHGLSGFFCIDSRDYTKPYLVASRLEGLMKHSTRRNSGMRLSIMDADAFETTPVLGFMYDRWPRFKYKTGANLDTNKRSSKPDPPEKETETFALSVQYFSSKDTILQQYHINIGEGLLSKDSVDLDDLSIKLPLCFRNTNFLDNDDFNDEYDQEIERFVVGKCNLITTRELPPELLSPDQKTDDNAFMTSETNEDEPERGDIDEKGSQDSERKSGGLLDQEDSDENNTPQVIPTQDNSTKDTIDGRSAADEDSVEVNPDSHESTPEIKSQIDRPTHVAVVVTPLVNGDASHIDNEGHITFKKPKGLAKIEITISYRLLLLDAKSMEALKSLNESDNEPENESQRTGTDSAESSKQQTSSKESVSWPTSGENFPWNCTLIATEARGEMLEALWKNSRYQRISFSQDQALDFCFRRNLEHIISVCCIPIGPETNYHSFSKIRPIAITCGDIAGHRITSRASISAFRFLRAMLSFLKKENQTAAGDKSEENSETAQKRQTYIGDMCNRIEYMLQGHIYWICDKAQCLTGQSFSGNYWPSGHPIEKGRHPDELYWLPPPSLLDAPLQLLQVFEYFDLYKREMYIYEMPDWIPGILYDKIRDWIIGLHSCNKRGTYVFSKRVEYQSVYESKTKFRLTDHAVICSILKVVEKFRMVQSGQNEKLSLIYEQQKDVDRQMSEEQGLKDRILLKKRADRIEEERRAETRIDQILPYYTHNKVRRKTLKRFTAENPISKHRTLVTARWPDEVRFLFHTKDILLFHATNVEPFNLQGNPKKESSGLTDPWKYADDRWIKLIEAQAFHDQYQDMNWSKPLWYAMALILGSKEKKINNESTEVLVQKARAVLLRSSSTAGLFPGLIAQGGVPVSFIDEKYRDSYWFTTFEVPLVLWLYGNTSSGKPAQGQPSNGASFKGSTSANLNSTKDAAKIGQQVQKHVYFANRGPVLDPMGLVTVLDDWLLIAPPSLDFLKEADFNDPPTDEIDPESLSKREQDVTKLLVEGAADHNVGVVIDVAKGSDGSEISTPQRTSTEVVVALGRKRNVYESKKRILWLPHGDKASVISCLEVSSGNEKENILSFFERHVKHEKYFLDSATAALNEWETELHLSFFRISRPKDRALVSFPDSTSLAATTMSFRFAGDFSDRYWTCMFLEDRPEVNVSDTLESRLQEREGSGMRSHVALTSKREDKGENEDEPRLVRPWQQRKVLELFIYNRMLDDLHKNIQEILDDVKRRALRLDPPEGSDWEYNPFKSAIKEARKLQDLGKNGDYATIAEEWGEYIQILTVVEENLTDNIERIRQWSRREEDRQSQKPRWTQRDQQNHFTTILRLTILSQRKANDIERLKDSVKSFRESLPGQLESIREDIAFRGSQNINQFTYVTVVFLPLGFATGLLSMNGLPSRSLLVHLVYVALGALGLTLYVLLNLSTAKSFIKPMAKPIRSAKRMILSTLRFIGGPIWTSILFIGGPILTSILFTCKAILYALWMRLGRSSVHYWVRLRIKLQPKRASSAEKEKSSTEMKDQESSIETESQKTKPDKSWRQRRHDQYAKIKAFSFRDDVKKLVQLETEEQGRKDHRGIAYT